MDSPEAHNADELTDGPANNDYSLHEAVFHGHQVPENFNFTSEQINLKDIHGNTPLHLAVILGRHDWLNQLLKSGANILAKNRQGWTPLAEAISYGNRSISKCDLSSFYLYEASGPWPNRCSGLTHETRVSHKTFACDCCL